MTQLLANTAIVLSIAGFITACGALVGALANYLNARARLLEHTMQISELQRKQTELSAVQQAVQVASATSARLPAAPGGEHHD
jgi:hypothetical protein